MTSPSRHAHALLLAALLLSTACSPAGSPTGPPSPPGPLVAASSPESPGLSAPASITPSPSPSLPVTGFAFAAADVIAYYESQGYRCAPVEPSATAAGFALRTCHSSDAAGRILTVGIVTDPDGGLANGFASVRGAADEPVLAPIDALDPLAGFLGAMLGADAGSAQLEWLAGHLGDAYAETASGTLRLATYSESAEDHSTLYVELANQAYLDAPAPSPTAP